MCSTVVGTTYMNVVWIILGYFFAFSFFAKMRKNFRILCEKSEENEEIAKGRNPPFL